MKLKKFVAAIILGIFLAVNSISVYGAVKDLKVASVFAQASILSLEKKGIIKGDTKGNFNPKQEITRAEFVKMLVETMESMGQLQTASIPVGANPFKDVPNNHWAMKYIMAANHHSLVNGITTESFAPSQKMTREQMALIFFRILVPPTDWRFYGNYSNVEKLGDKNQVSEWAKKGVEIMKVVKLMDGTAANLFSPKSNVTKEQAAVVLNRYMSERLRILDALSYYNRNLKPQEDKYITLGSKEEEIFNAMGITYDSDSTYIDTELAYSVTETGYSITGYRIPRVYFRTIPYEDSTIFLDSSNKVVGWHNEGNLKVKVNAVRTDKPFTLGSSLEEVFAAMGTPKEIMTYNNKAYVYYNDAFVALYNNKVIAWSMYEKNSLNVSYGKLDPQAKGILFGDSLDVVVSVMGTPHTFYKDDRGLVLLYGESYIYLDDNLVVKDWYNKGELKIRTVYKNLNAPPVWIGSDKLSALYAMGNPDKIIRGELDAEAFWYGEYWLYGDSKLHFDKEGKVDGWQNKGSLKLVETASEGKSPIRIGTSRDVVFKNLGTPEYYYLKTIKYGNAFIYVDDNNYVSEIQNKSRDIRINTQPTTNEDFHYNDYIEKVLNAMGEPDSMKKENGTSNVKAFYGNSYIEFKEDKLVGYDNKDSNLRINIGQRQPGATFTLYSNLSELTAAQGTPNCILSNNGQPTVLYYGKDIIRLDGQQRVIEWENISETLNLDKSRMSDGFIEFGISASEVVRIMGSPDRMHTGPNPWHQGYSATMYYGPSMVLLGMGSEGYIVEGWENKGVLHLKQYNLGKHIVRLGDSIDSVTEKLGTPNLLLRVVRNPYTDRYLTNSSYVYQYGKTKIRFSNEMKVDYIYNGNNDIVLFDSSPIIGNGVKAELGFTKEQLLQTIGEPVGLAEQYWDYQDGMQIWFDAAGKAGQFWDNKGLISMGSKVENAPDIKIGSTMQQVLDKYGSPASYALGDLSYRAEVNGRLVYNGKNCSSLSFRLNDAKRVIDIFYNQSN